MVKEKIVWNDQHETILRQWGEASACYRFMHHKSFLLYKKLSLRFTLPIIVISTVTGTANFAQETFPPSWKKLAPVVIGGLNLFSAIMTTVLQFLKINELMESHRVSSILYGKLSRTIRLQLTLPVFERNYDGGEFVEQCGNEYDRLIEQSPPIPTQIIKHFEKEYPTERSVNKFMDKLKLTNDSKIVKIVKPEIIDITPIYPYSGEEELKTTKEVLNAFKKPIHHPASPSQRHKVLKELKSLNNKSLVASKINRFSNAKSQEPLSIPEEEPETPEPLSIPEEEPREHSTEPLSIPEEEPREHSTEVIDELLEEVIVDVGEPTVSVKDIAASFDKSRST